MNTRVSFVLLVIALIATFGTTSCQKPGVQASRDDTDLTSQKVLSIDDEDFLRKAETTEVRQTTFSQAALEKSNNEDVRRFARQVIDNYQDSLSELAALMKAKNLAEPSAEIEELKLDATNRLHRLSGSAFDDEFVSLMAAEQQEAVAIFDSAAASAADSDIRNYAKRVLQFLRKDFATALTLQKKLAEKDHS